jgi:hypothetical protein
LTHLRSSGNGHETVALMAGMTLADHIQAPFLSGLTPDRIRFAARASGSALLPITINRPPHRRAKEHMHLHSITSKAVAKFRPTHSRRQPEWPQGTLSRQELQRIVAEMLD